jgi:hypothetical protein
VYIGAVFNLDRFFDVGNKPPEFSFDVIFRNRSNTVENRVKRHAVLEVALFEVRSLFLELLKRIETTLFKSELTVAD